MTPPGHHWSLALCLGVSLVGSMQAETPLHQRIDQLIESRTSAPAPTASDAEFLRRLYLDLTGTIPTVDVARGFLKDPSPDKRLKLIDRLLSSPEHARHLAHVFDVMLMERAAPKNVPTAVWHEYLRDSFARNKPWDQLAREILSATGAEPKNRGPARFILDRNAEPNVLVRDISRLFLGTDLQCAQCHDHPRIDDYRQLDYYGLFAFLSRVSVVTDSKLKLAVLSEKAEGEVTFQSVFDPAKVTKSTGPRVPGLPAIKEGKAEKGQEYLTKPDKNTAGVPKVSRRALLGAELVRPENRAFRRNIANRLWAMLMGRGLIHPLDLAHEGNPPTHPEVLDLLTEQMSAHQFDLRWMMRELVSTRIYQRSSQSESQSSASPFVVAQLKPLAPETLAFSLHQATGMTDVDRQALGKAPTEAALYARVLPQVTPLISAFAGQPGKPQEFEPTLDQVLFLSNGPILRSWLQPRPGNLLGRLNALPQAEAIAEEMYLAILTRWPSEEEKKEVAAFLQQRQQARLPALQEYVWALLTSTEFRFNH